MLAKLNAGMQHFRIRHPHHLPTRRAGIDDSQTQRNAQLHSGKADARHRLHHIDHILPDRADLVRDLGNISCRGPQGGMGPGYNSPHHIISV